MDLDNFGGDILFIHRIALVSGMREDRATSLALTITFKHYKSTEYMKRTTLSITMIGNEKQKIWQNQHNFQG